MTEHKNLYKLIDELNQQIKKLDNGNFKIEPKIKTKTIIKPIVKSISNNSNIINSYSLIYTKNNTNKKYVALFFDENNNIYDSDNSIKINSNNLKSFIKLTKSNILINYLISIELEEIPTKSFIGCIFFGIKTNSSSKVKIIKGSKIHFDFINYPISNNKINISNTILYNSLSCNNYENYENYENLCMIVNLPEYANINSSKSILKILSLSL
jgi:hypothetical protein